MSQTRRHGPRSLVTCGKGIRHLTTLSEMIVPHFKFNIKYLISNLILKLTI